MEGGGGGGISIFSEDVNSNCGEISRFVYLVNEMVLNNSSNFQKCWPD